MPPGSVTLMLRLAGLGWSAQCNIRRRFFTSNRREKKQTAPISVPVVGYELLETSDLLSQ